MLERATHSLAHRGPDDSGTTTILDTRENIEVGLGNRRLAVLDLSSLGHQPMCDSNTGNWIVYNGEIYNCQEIREQLEQQGFCFRSHSDTEVLLKAYSHWGEKCLSELRGMFAFAIWDARRHRLFLARDPMGIKPIYYYAAEKHFLFASEVRTLLGTGLIPRHLDRAGLINYLTFGSAYDPITLIRGIAALRPGYFLIWQNGVVRQEKYWDLVDKNCDQICGFRKGPQNLPGAWSPNLADNLAEAVRLQLRSDVPTGVFLSGGIDSSSLVALSSAIGVKPSTYSIVFPETEFNEAQFSRAIALHFRTDHHEIPVSQSDALQAVPETLEAMDQPTMDGLNTFLVSRYARAAGVKVALSGLGGDEFFGGYSSFRTVLQMERFSNFWHQLPEEVRRAAAEAFALFAPSSDRNRKLFALAHENGSLVHPYFLSRALFDMRSRQGLFPSATSEDEQRASATLRNTLDSAEGLDPVNRVSYLEARCYMLNTLLRDSDCMSMAHGLEMRVPLLDQEVSKNIFSLPGVCKLSRSVPKPLLLNAVHGMLPDHIVRRPKRGFALPFRHWLRDQLRPIVHVGLRRIPDGPLAEILDAPAVEHVWQDFLRERTSWSRPWSLYVLQRWSELHLC